MSNELEMKKLRTKEIVKTGYGYQSLKKFAERGWISKPILRHFGKGRGRGSSLFFEPEVIQQIELIKFLKNLRYSTSQIDKVIKGDSNK